MAITFDQALGTLSTGVFQSTQHITTSAAAAAGSRIVVVVSWFDTNANVITGINDGSAYTQDAHIVNGSDKFDIWSRVLVGSLASGTSITITWNSQLNGGGQLAAACSYLGTTGVDTTASNTTTGTGFSSGAASNTVADALFVGGAGNETATTSVGGTNTNGTSRFDIWNTTAQQGLRMLDVIASSIASQALTGTWASSSTATTGALVIYKGTSGPTTPDAMPISDPAPEFGPF